MSEDPMVAALLRERQGLVQSGLTDRVADVDEQLRLHGHTPSDGQEPASGAPASRSTPPKGRKTRSSETA